MLRAPGLKIVCLLLAAGIAAGCKPKPPAGPPTPTGYFATPFQSESEFIVQAIVSDLAEQMVYAASHRLPDPKYFSVAASEKPGSPADAPVYALQIRLDPKQQDLKLELAINGPIWSPTVYQTVAGELARAAGLSARGTAQSEDTALLSKLADSSAETIEQENQALSAALEKDFANPELHAKAALLLGGFLLRDRSGYFFEIRSPLCRMTAHLAMARFLCGEGASGLDARMAEAMLLTLVEAQSPALEQLQAIGTNDAAVAPLVRALQTRNTGDFRPLDKATNRSQIESVEWFAGRAGFADMPSAWLKLSDKQRQTIDFVRIANQGGYSVEMGHELLRVAIPLELQEIGRVYKLAHGEPLPRRGVLQALNQLPEHCLSQEAGGTVHVRVIGWGQWALFLQRHLCHAVEENFHFMDYKWGVHDDAREFAAKCAEAFDGLRLYPFVRRLTCTDEQAYHRAVDDAFKVTVATPHLVPAECWNYLCYKVSFAPLYKPNPNPHVNEWHSHNPLPGTVYDLEPRLDHPSLVSRPDVVARFEQLRHLAPYDCRLAHFLVNKKYHKHPTYDQAMALYGSVLPYSVSALRAVAHTVQDGPDQYEKLMVQAAELNPDCFYSLADYLLEQQQEDKAAYYLDQGCDSDPDRVSAASRAEWRVRYYLRKGRTDKARRIADEAGEVYSFSGLKAKAAFFEATGDFAAASDWFAKIQERYDDSSPLLAFCLRHPAQFGGQHLDPKAQKLLAKLFPKGLEHVSLKDFQGPPVDGVLIKEQNQRVESAGLKAGDVIVAVYGIRVHNFQQYTTGRQLKDTPEMELIVWQGDAYREFKPSPPQHRFDADFGDYPPR